uniref:RNase H type-1 domain-containing protein n=1 Tax=Gossypium raimondii TaxID=29730 RepID=A0A0D2SKS1_GOSRA|nr:hypothetical protein B456_007G275100 [Gossypium raimondii]
MVVTEYESISVALIEESKERIKKFEYVRFRVVPRTKNQAAHKMAEARKHFDSPMFWIEEAPEKVTRIVDLHRGSMGREEVLNFSE